MLNKIGTLILLLAGLSVLASCGGVKTKMASTKSGRPEAEIKTTDVDQIRTVLTKAMEEKGYGLWDSPKPNMVFMKDIENEEVIKEFIPENPETHPKAEIKYGFNKHKDSVTVKATISITYQDKRGTLKHTDIKENAYMFNEIYPILQDVKRRIESK